MARDPMRQALKAARRALGPRERIAAAEGLARQLLTLPALARPGHVAGYWAMDGELSLHAVLPRLPEGSVYCLPCLGEAGRLQFAAWRPGDGLVANRFGIPEPDVAADSRLEPMQLDVVLAPLVGFDRQGHRLGTGGGWYDRSFAPRQRQPAPPLLVGVGYAFQECQALPPQPWDVAVDLVATDAELIDCRTPHPSAEDPC